MILSSGLRIEFAGALYHVSYITRGVEASAKPAALE